MSQPEATHSPHKKVNLDLTKRPGERNEVLIRRFSREMLLSGLAAEWKERKERTRPISRRKRKELAVRLTKLRRARRGY